MSPRVDVWPCANTFLPPRRNREVLQEQWTAGEGSQVKPRVELEGTLSRSRVFLSPTSVPIVFDDITFTLYELRCYGVVVNE